MFAGWRRLNVEFNKFKGKKIQIEKKKLLIPYPTKPYAKNSFSFLSLSTHISKRRHLQQTTVGGGGDASGDEYRFWELGKL